ncbi:MFS transporter [Saccharopolyspora indica]|uniref:MFS transporter n=1 Tax=Saccharopolyspora indica TaxID=1229659 RepID=UPI0022EB14F8|nr:MFS transporter [Saccharopolyspora indica]MDA3643995.1 MFS transporter [Saccharopolyspora indica]
MDTTEAPAPGREAGRREWIGLVVLALPTLLLSLDFSVIYLAIPHLSSELGATSTQQLWIADSYGFMVAGFLIAMGTLGDRIGRRKLLLIGAALFGLASVFAAFSASAEMLIVARAAMGVAGATLMPSTLALISTMFQDPRQAGFAIAAWMACFMGGMAIGPAIGGVLLNSFWWGSVFLLGVPVMLLLLVVGPGVLPEHRDPGAGRLDLVSVVLSLLAVLPAVHFLKEVAKSGIALLPGIAAVVGLVFATLFLLRQRALTTPLVDLSLFRHRTFSAALLIGLLVPALQGGTYFLVVQHLQNVEGLPPMTAGLWLVPSTLIMVGSVLLAPMISRRIRPAYVIAAGLVVGAIGYAIIARIDGPGQLDQLWAGYSIMVLGVGMPSGLGTALVLGAAPPERVGSASSISEAGGEFGMAMGVAVLGSLATQVYRDELTGAVPAGLPADASAAATDSITAAVPAAQRLPGPLGDELLRTVRDCFTAGLNTVSAVSGVLFACLAVFCVATLRGIPAANESEPETVGAAAEMPVEPTSTGEPPQLR